MEKTIIELPDGVALGPSRAIARYFQKETHEIYLLPDTPLISRWRKDLASTGIEWTMFSNIPIGVSAYPWFIKNKEMLEKAGPLLLTVIAWLTAILDPFMSILRGHPLKFLRQLFTFASVSVVLLFMQPLYMLLFYIRNER